MWTVAELSVALPKLLFTEGWQARASHNTEAAIGGLRLTTWSSGDAQQPGMWFEVELPEARMVTELQFRSPATGGGRGRGGRGAAAEGAPPPPPPGPGFPRGYKVDVSLDGASWQTVAEGAGTGISTTIAFAPVRAKHVRITQTAAPENAPAWTIESLQLYEPGSKVAR